MMFSLSTQSNGRSKGVLRKRGTIAPFRVLLIVLTGLLPLAARGEEKSRWTLTFAEEFGGTTLDGGRWWASDGAPNQREAVTVIYRPEQVAARAGRLILSTRPLHSDEFFWGALRHLCVSDRVNFPRFVSGEIHTRGRFAQRYGRFEIRCRLPSERGNWPAFYLLPASDAWPPEIDVVEYVGNEPHTLYFTNHWRGDRGIHQFHTQRFRDPFFDPRAWHTYRLEWRPEHLRWFVDGVLHAEITEQVPDVLMYLRLNTAVGGEFAGEASPAGRWPQYLEVDYIRVWQMAGAPTPPKVRGVTPQERRSRIWRRALAPVSFLAGWLNPLLLSALPLAGLVALYRPAWGLHVLGAATAGAGANYLLFLIRAVPGSDALGLAALLLFAELYNTGQILGYIYTVWPRPEPSLSSHEDPTLRRLFVLITTVNEGCSVVEPTLRSVQAAVRRYQEAFPHARVTIALCNDGRVRGWTGWREIEALAERCGVRCLTRVTPGGAKAGNIEHARDQLEITGDALLAVFDADMAPRPEFFLQMVPPLADPAVGWTQVSQYYLNQNNLVARWAQQQQTRFYEAICPGKARLNACFLCGTNFVLRAQALDEIGGFPQDSITEDIDASIRMHRKGWRSVFLPGILAEGLGPSDLHGYFAQQRRWATGDLTLLLHRYRNLLWDQRLAPSQRIQYFLSLTYYLRGVAHFIFLLLPLGWLLFGGVPLAPTDAGALLRYVVPYGVLGLVLLAATTRGRLLFGGMVIGFGSFPTLLGSFGNAIVNRRIGFAVTPKGKKPSMNGFAGFVCLGQWHLVSLIWISAALTQFPQNREWVLTWFCAFWLLVMGTMLLATLWLAAHHRTHRGKTSDQKGREQCGLNAGLH